MSAIPLVAVPTEADLEFDRQIDAFAQTGLAERLDLAEGCFRAWLEPLRDLLPAIGTGGEGIPFVVVIPDLPVVEVLAAATMVGGAGFTTMEPDDLARFQPLPQLDVPSTPYLLLDVDPGPDTLNLPPRRRCPGSRPPAAHRSPSPKGSPSSCPIPGCCARATASRCSARARATSGCPRCGSAPGAPRLGWCYQGAPHTWLGSASCGGRVAEAPRAV